MKDVVIVSTARTPIGRAYKGAFNNTKSPTLGGHVVREAVQRAGLDGAEIEDVIMGSALPAGTTGWNIGRMSAIAAGLPVSVAGMTLDRQCSSGLMAIATAAKQIICDGMSTIVAGGLDSISLVQDKAFKWIMESTDPAVLAMNENAYMPMLQTAEVVAKRYNVSRESQDEYALTS